MKEKSVFTEYYYRAKKSIAQNGLTNSKRPECFVLGQIPTHIKCGVGGTIEDVRGKVYADYVCSLGASLFGHGNYKIRKAIERQLEKGIIYSLGSDIEVEAADRIKGLFPFIDKLKFLKTGTEATTAALKIARAYTGQNIFLVEGYHGWTDPFIDAWPGYGVDKNTIRATYRGIDVHWDKLEEGAFAAVMLEPVELDMSPERRVFLNRLREVCTKTNTVLIFDEIITGFRVPKKSIATYWGVTPDIICLGKAIAGGMPLSIVAGKDDIMEGNEYFVSSTFAGECLSLAALMEVCDLLNTTKYSIDNLWEKGQQFLAKFNSLCPSKIEIEGYPTRGRFRGDQEFITLFNQECAKGGVLFGPSWFYSFPLVELDDMTFNICEDVIRNINAGRVKIEGEKPRSPFAQSQRKKNA